jgi:hypothetical protein
MGIEKEIRMELAIYLLGILSGVFAAVAAANAFQLRRGCAMGDRPVCKAACRAGRQATGRRSWERRLVPLRSQIQLPDLAGLERLRGIAATSSKARGHAARARARQARRR